MKRQEITKVIVTHLEGDMNVCVLNFKIPIHLIADETFHFSRTNVNLLVALEKMLGGSPKSLGYIIWEP